MVREISGRMTRKSVLDVLEPGDKVELLLITLGHLGYDPDDLYSFLSEFHQKAKPDYDDDSCNGSYAIEKKKRTPKGHWGFNQGYSVVFILDLAKRMVDNPPEGVEITVNSIYLECSELFGEPRRNIYRGSLRPYRKRIDKLIEDIALEREVLKIE